MGAPIISDIFSVKCVQARRGEEERLYRLLLRQAVTLTRQARALARLQTEIEMFQDILNSRTVEVSPAVLSFQIISVNMKIKPVISLLVIDERITKYLLLDIAQIPPSKM